MLMESNDAISQKIWDGSIPVSFCIFPNELPHELLSTPPPFLMLVPRVTYFPLVLEKTVLQFRTYLQGKFLRSRTRSRSDLTDDSSPAHSAEESRPTKNDLDYWLSYDGVPLKWHYPVGLLFDLYGSPNNLPWEITVHFGDYPTDILLAPPVSRSAIEAIFLATLKEADQLKHRGREGPGPIFDELLPEDQHRLWNGLLQHRFDLFWSINKRFMQGAPAPVRSLPPPYSAEDDTGNGQNTRIFGEDVAALMVATGAMKAFRHCPFRVYFSPHSFETSSPTMTYLQTLVSPFIGVEGTPATFSDVMVTLLKCSNVQLHAEDFTFLVHGVEVPPDTPAQWMCEWMAYPDNFVHVVACKRKE
ncbi:Autophagy protein 5 [Taenia crassiceps]|uniref:Autophagy protein 5 n=1 Tax=Taenia crassiceps TaxID=6207 RepID=A0ABR4Q6Y4_9CEST